MSFDLADYVPVAERVVAFYEKHPDGRIVSAPAELLTITDGRQAFAVTAYCYRSADDQAAGLPAGIGTALEPYPGQTPFTRDSEAMNAETAAVGRALWAAGLLAHRGASREEVAARQPADGVPRATAKARMVAAAGDHTRTAQAVWSLLPDPDAETVPEDLATFAEDVCAYVVELRALHAPPDEPTEPPETPEPTETPAQPTGPARAREAMTKDET